MRRSFLLLTCALALTIWGGPVRAQATPAPRPTLARALAALEPPKQDLFLTVGADKIELPPDTPPAEPSDRPGAVGETYGRLARDFGGVTALAPPTMAVLNAHPGVPDPYDGMPPGDALTLLLAGLNPVQWAAITGENGLGMGDLTDDAQRGLFREVLPSQDLLIPKRHSEPVTLVAQGLDATARLRLGRQMTIDVPMVGPGGDGEGSLTPPLSGLAVSDTYPILGTVPPPIYGAVLRQVLPNRPKDAGLDYQAPALKRSLRLDGILTVGDLVARVGRAAGLELYADRRYETRPVTLLGRRTARAVDLLRAVAFCVTGTFRKVGPAYVLTDDLEGTATRRQRLGRFLEEGKLKGEAGLGAAQDSLAAAHGGDALPWLGGAGLSDAQRALPAPSQPGGGLTVTFAQLTPAQQDLVLGFGGVDKGRPFKLMVQTHLLLLSPAAPGPVILGYLSPWFGPSIGSWIRADWQRRMASAKKYVPPLNAPPPPPPPPLAHFPAAIPRRALLAAPRTARALDTVIAGMRTSGFNQLWLEVFVGGHPRLDLLAEALARTKGTGISVIPTLELLRWDKDAPAGALDLTALGETSGEQQAWQRAWSQDYTRASAEMPVKPSPDASPPEVWACPAAPATEAILLALVRRLAATPGVTTLALRDAVPPGYIHLDRSGGGGAGPGYVPALRLALLRRDHLDPLDLDWGTGGGADTSLPLFDDSVNIPALRQAAQDWVRLRDAASRDLLRHLLAAAQDTGGPRFRFLVRQWGDESRYAWYGLWESPQAPLPEVPVTASGMPSLPGEPDYAPVAHSQCRVNLIVSGIGELAPYSPADALQKLSAGWDGLVLDATAPWEEDWIAYYGWGVKQKVKQKGPRP